jgi:hypothetical protein
MTYFLVHSELHMDHIQSLTAYTEEKKQSLFDDLNTTPWKLAGK